MLLQYLFRWWYVNNISYVYTEEKLQCPHDVGHKWKDKLGTDLGDKLDVICSDTNKG